MFCKNCGRELPPDSNFCPSCGTPQAVGDAGDVNDETMVFRPSDEEEEPIDLTAFEAVLSEKRPEPEQEEAYEEKIFEGEPMDEVVPPQRPQYVPKKRIEAPHTTYFERENEPYHKSSAGKKVAVTLLVLLILGGAAGGGIWYYLENKPDTSKLEAAERYMLRGRFEDALGAYENALADAKDPSAIKLMIDQLKSFRKAEDALENGDYASALATLGDLEGRITDTGSELYKKVGEMQEKARQAMSDGEFAKDIGEAQEYLNDGKYDAAAGKLDSLSADGDLTEEQKNQVDNLRSELEKAQSTAQKQEENRQQKEAKKEEFRQAIAKLEENDKAIVDAKTPEEALELTSISFEGWDALLNDMYDYLATILNADQYAAEESDYKKWIEERDSGASNAKNESSEEAAGNLAATSFKQSYTKTRCYKILDKM